MSRKGQMIKFQDVKRPAYDLYRTETYDPAAKTPGQANYVLEDIVSSWKRNIKISPMDYKPSRTKPAGFV
jgi:hypothetical protein